MKSLFISFCFLLSILAAPVVAEPEFFTPKKFGEAKVQAAEDNKLLFVKATADWCGPCKMMDRTTFKDQRVIDWLTSKAICVSVDVDEETATAKQLRVRAMPTTIVFRGDEEVARVVGYRDADALLTWLAKADGGEADPVAARPTKPAEHDIMARMEYARNLVSEEDFEAATDEYLWLWEHMLSHDLSMTGVRGSFMASDMHRLAKASPQARKRFAALRDETGKRLQSDKKTWDDLRDWLTLNERVLDDRNAVLAWIDRIEDRPTAPGTFRRVSDIVRPVLIDEKRWALYGSLIQDGAAEMRHAVQMLELDKGLYESVDEERAKEIKAIDDDRFRKQSAQMQAGLLAAGRESEARVVADLAIEAMNDLQTRRMIVETAITAGQAREWHIEILEGAHADLEHKIRSTLDD